ncbi:MAG: hypothetical protein AAF551_06815 [Bacteroidota bacterium]
MKKINKVKTLYCSLVIIDIVFAILLLLQVVILVIPDLIHQDFDEERVFGAFHYLVIVFQGSLLLLGFWRIQQALRNIIRLGSYNDLTERKIRKGGMLIISFGIVSFLINLLKISEMELDTFVHHLILSVFTSLVGLSLLILSDFVKNGMVLKEDVDLTI